MCGRRFCSWFRCGGNLWRGCRHWRGCRFWHGGGFKRWRGIHRRSRLGCWRRYGHRRHHGRGRLLGRWHVERGRDGGDARRDGELGRARGGDLQRLLRRHDERLARARVADAAGLAGHELELAEPRQDKRAVGRLALDNLRQHLQNLAGCGLLDAGAERQFLDQTAFRVNMVMVVHGLFPPALSLLFGCNSNLPLLTALFYHAIRTFANRNFMLQLLRFGKTDEMTEQFRGRERVG